LKKPSSCLFAKRETVNKISLVACSTQNIQKPKAFEAENPLVAPIYVIKGLPFAMVHTRGGLMTDPPHGQEESQQQTISTCFVLDQTGFEMPSATFTVLER
jgi:hypothetical protein